MEVIEIPINVRDFLGAREISSGTARSPGLHVSDIIKDIMQKLAPKRFGRPGLLRTEPLPLEKFEVGFAWEEVMGEFIGKRLDFGDSIIRPGEQELDGIFMTPDWFNIDQWYPIETKATWASARRGIEDDFFVHWRWQLMAYCKGLEATRGRVCTFFINGDYKSDDFPIIKMWELSFTPREIDNTWRMLMNHAKKAKLL